MAPVGALDAAAAGAPAAVVVTGAGVGEANGLYLPSGRERNGSSVFANDQGCLLARESKRESEMGEYRLGWVLARERQPLYGAPTAWAAPISKGWLAFRGALPVPRVEPAVVMWQAVSLAMLYFKEQGNEAFAAERYKEAEALWSRGLVLSSKMEEGPETEELVVVLFANRAEARLRLWKWEKALTDAQAVLRRRPGHEKALLRAASAARELGRHADALGFAKACLDEHPRSAEARRLRQELEGLLEQDRRRVYKEATASWLRLYDAYREEVDWARMPPDPTAAHEGAIGKAALGAFRGYGSCRGSRAPAPPEWELAHHRLGLGLPREEAEATDRYLEILRDRREEEQRRRQQVLDEYPGVKMAYKARWKEDVILGKAATLELKPDVVQAAIGARAAPSPQPLRSAVEEELLRAARAPPLLQPEEEHEVDQLFAGMEGRPPPASAPPPSEGPRRDLIRQARAALLQQPGAAEVDPAAE